MANTLNIQKVMDGPRNAVIKVFLASDGASGELADQAIIDVSTLSGAPSKVHLNRLMGGLKGFDVLFEWDAATDKPILMLEAGLMDLEFKYGLPNDAGAGVTGDITITTTGFTAAGDMGWLLLEVTKD